MATKAAQLAEWLKELLDKVNADGNISYNDVLKFQKEKNLNQKQFDAIFAYLNEKGIDVIYDDDDDEEEPTDADFAAEAGEDLLSDDMLLDEDKDDLDEDKDWEDDTSDADYAAGGVSDPVRLYLRECGSNPLLSAEQEMNLAKTIERGKQKDATPEEQSAARDGQCQSAAGSFYCQEISRSRYAFFGFDSGREHRSLEGC